MNWLYRFFFALSFISIACIAEAGPSYDVYTEDWGLGWGSWSWPNTIQLTRVNARALRGSYSISVKYSNAWSGFAPGAWNSFDTTGFTTLMLGVYNAVDGDDLWLFAKTSSGIISNALRLADYTTQGALVIGKWTWIGIPLADLGLGNNPTLSYFAIESGKANALVYFDDIRFGTNIRFYEGLQGFGPVVQEVKAAPSMYMWPWNATVNQPSSNGDYWLDINPTGSWSGIQLQGVGAWNDSSKYGGLSIAFQKTSSSQRLYVSLVNSAYQVIRRVELSDTYLPPLLRPMKANKWYRVVIPISQFFTGWQSIGGVIVEADIAARYLVDDVVLVQKLGWPIKGITRSVTGFHFGENWIHGCSSYRKLHSGNDYTDAANQGRQIYAASRGFVKQVIYQKDWGYAVVVQHEGGFTTSYLHLNLPSVTQEQEVQRGTPLGTTIYLEDDKGNPISHLHFGLRIADFNNTVSQAGALPEVTCTDPSGVTYPAFPASFIDSEEMDWGILP